MKVPGAELRAFEQDKRGAIVGDAIARRLGWAVGDEVVLESPLYPGSWRFKIDGVYTAAAKSANGSNFIARWDYFNDALPAQRFDKDCVGVIVSRVDDPSRSAEIAVAIDRLFEERRNSDGIAGRAQRRARRSSPCTPRSSRRQASCPWSSCSS